MRTPLKYSWVLLVSLFFVSPHVNAASLYIDPAFSALSRGDTLYLSVRLDVDEASGECINAVDAVINYSQNISPVDVSIGDSILSMWVEQPIIDTANRTITFAGGIPNGYCGRVTGDPRLTNNLATLVFRSPGFNIGASTDDINATVSFSPESAAYLNDGFGTMAPLTTFGATIELGKTAGPTLVDPWREALATDVIPPEEFFITLEQYESAFGGRYFIVFNTTDKQTGIDHYQVMEEPASKYAAFEWGRGDAPWVPARSPYKLEDQTLNSTIRVKAIDKAGNEYIATLVPNEDLRQVSPTLIILIFAIAFVVLIIVTMVLVAVSSYRKKKRAMSENVEEPDSTI